MTPAASVFEEAAIAESLTRTSDEILVESAWSYRHRPDIGARLRKRQEGLPAEITEIAWKAQNRLHKRYMTLMARGKEQRKTMTAVARELLGFIWAIGIKAEASCKQQLAA